MKALCLGHPKVDLQGSRRCYSPSWNRNNNVAGDYISYTEEYTFIVVYYNVIFVFNLEW